ncbi:MAG: ABC transporter permease, partial [Prevotellaceae bacterium]|nr:ABC transporter permease [Prevotellaceae bacterium]
MKHPDVTPAAKRRDIIRAGSRYYRRYYRLVATATLITVAVITGSLVVGDSVRTTLVRRVAERLGDTESILFARRSFLDEEFAAKWPAARGVLMVDGFVAHDGKHTPVTVWGVDDAAVPRGSVHINAPLARELDMKPSARRPVDLVLRLPAEGLVPSGSLFVTDTYTTSLRLQCDSLLDARHGGNLSLRNEQTLPYNLFVNRAELAETLGAKGKINLLLSPRKLTTADLHAAWNYRMSGITLHHGNGFTEIAADRLFLPDEVTRSITTRNHAPNRLFSYLANSLESLHSADAVPYSFVTALDTYDGEPLEPGDLILADYTARRLRVGVGDTVRMSFFTAGDLKRLRTDSVALRVKRIVPLADLQADSTLTARFPGMTDATRCTDWNSDLPIDMGRITAEDELYWERYRTTPKALVSYAGLAPRWSNAYGNATAVRVADTQPDLSLLRPEMMDIHLVHPREAGIYAARNGVDFAGLFLALGCFIIISALLLSVIPLAEMLYRRRGELALLTHLGYTPRRITALLWREASPVVAVTALGGVVVGLGYTTVILWLLGNVWQGATHTDGFSVYPAPLTIAVGLTV